MESDVATGMTIECASRRVYRACGCWLALVFAFSCCFIAPAHGAFIARATVTSGPLVYVGLGDIGGGVGSGRYTLGTCVTSAGATTCTFSGTYVETAQSDHAPGTGGSFTMRLTYSGTVTPVIARSITAGSDVLQFAPGGGYSFKLDVFPASGGQFSGTYPAPVFSDSIVFAAFLDPNAFSCSGLSAGQACRVGQVGLVPGATISGGVNPFDFTIPGNFAIGGVTPVDVIEFYNASLDHYFITYIAAEIANLDAGRTPTRWTRTGYSFRAYASQQAGSSPVCRFYIPPGLGDSHFFGRGTVECDDTARKFPALVLEERLFLFVFLPINGACGPGTRPVYRVFSNRADANHRYMVDPAVRQQMVAQGWLAEGDGPDQVVMCAPT